MSEAILEKISDEKTLLYWVENGKIRFKHDLADVVLKALQNVNPAFQYISERNESGEMVADVFFFGRYAVVHEWWRPYELFSWAESRLTLIKLRPPVTSD